MYALAQIPESASPPTIGQSAYLRSWSKPGAKNPETGPLPKDDAELSQVLKQTSKEVADLSGDEAQARADKGYLTLVRYSHAHPESDYAKRVLRVVAKEVPAHRFSHLSLPF